MLSARILKELQTHGQMLDLELADTIGVPLAELRESLEAMSARGEIMGCSVTRYTGGQPVEALQYRVCGYVPTPGRGRKPGKVQS